MSTFAALIWWKLERKYMNISSFEWYSYNDLSVEDQRHKSRVVICDEMKTALNFVMKCGWSFCMRIYIMSIKGENSFVKCDSDQVYDNFNHFNLGVG